MQVIETRNVPIKAWIDGVAFEDAARRQVENVASLPFVHSHVALMPDVHWGMGATVGSVIATRGAIIPAAVGVDIGCGMVAARLGLTASDLPDSLGALRTAIEAAVPHGRTANGGPGDRGAWHDPPPAVASAWASLRERFDRIVEKHPKVAKANHERHLGTLGTGNHFIELCLDEAEGVWVMLHSGSRGVGGRIGSYFIELAKEDMRRLLVNLPDIDLAYLEEGSAYFDDYLAAVGWAQDYALANRGLMLAATVAAIAKTLGRSVELAETAVQCHHNYVSREHHFDADVLVTRKGAVRARRGELGIIPGSMGARSYIVRGKGNPTSFESCSHGAGRAMSRAQAKRTFTLEDHEKAVAGVECRRDADVIDETPGAYKPIDAVMAAQEDLVEVVHELKQVLCVKG
ncbi:MAG TPA: RtcB family protein [Polyangiaceae bacterium]|nr:RtcB family protein [Polyangiaceae bacterium]